MRYLSLFLGLFILVSCNPEAFLSKDKRVGSGDAGVVGADARVNSYARGLERYALAAQSAIVDGGAAAFEGGNVEDVNVAGDLSGSTLDDMRSVYCDGASLHVSWLDTADGEGNFAAKGLGRSGGERIVNAVAGRVGGAQIGVYDGSDVQMVDGSNVALPDASECGSETIAIPIGAPVMVFANVQAADGQTEVAQGYEYRSEACADASEEGAVLYRDLITYTTDAQSGSVDKQIVSSEAVSSNCSAADQAVANVGLSGDAKSTTNIVDGGTFAGGGAGGTAITGAIESGLSNVDCADVRSDTNNDGVIDENDDANESDFDTCGESQGAVATNYDFDEELAEQSEWHQFTTDCGGAAGSENVSVLGENVTASYPAYSGTVSYEQKIYTGTIDDDGTQTEVTRTDSPIATAINCSRAHTAQLSCGNNSLRPSGYGNGNTWTPTYGGGDALAIEREERVTEFDDAEATPPVPSAPSYTAWAASAGNTDCTWEESETFNTGCTAPQTATADGVRTRTHTVNSTTGATSATGWTITTPVTCSNPAVNGACGSANGGSYASAPSSNLCSDGTASAVSGSGPYTWTCSGSGGGTDASCSAAPPRPSDLLCMCKLAHASFTKEYDDNDNFQRSFRRTFERC